jgi:hypothetical protein
MKTRMIQYSQGRYLNSANIISANVYSKNNEHRVAIDLDTKDIAKSVVYTAAFENFDLASKFCQDLLND